MLIILVMYVFPGVRLNDVVALSLRMALSGMGSAPSGLAVMDRKGPISSGTWR